MAIPGSKLSRSLVDELNALRAKGHSIRRIAVELNLSRRTVHKYVRMIGHDPLLGKLANAGEDFSEEKGRESKNSI